MNPNGGNPWLTVGSPSYAAPLLNFNQAMNPQQQQQQGQQRPGQPGQPQGQQPSPAQQFAAKLRAFLAPGGGGTQGGSMQPGSQGGPMMAGGGAPMSLNAGGSVGGANALLSGLY